MSDVIFITGSRNIFTCRILSHRSPSYTPEVETYTKRRKWVETRIAQPVLDFIERSPGRGCSERTAQGPRLASVHHFKAYLAI